jgi:hypothetical protein
MIASIRALPMTAQRRMLLASGCALTVVAGTPAARTGGGQREGRTRRR